MGQKLDSFKCGYVSIIGKPNVGKSTLINTFLKQKILIVSNKPQTTRDKILAILTKENYQIIFVDTPGIYRPKFLLDKYMVKMAKSTFEDVDIIVFLIDAISGIEKEDIEILNLLSRIENKKKFLCVNKIDAVRKAKVLPLLDKAQNLCEFDEYIPISALKNDNLDLLLEKIVESLPESSPLYPKDQITNKEERFHVKELIREKILEHTREEIPHAVAVTIDEFKERENKDIIYIKANIWVERDSQKAIIIGNKANMLKEIGTEARKEIERFLGKRIFLDLWVKVYEKWKKDERALKRLGYG
jgi:GTP-binding protein Era